MYCSRYDTKIESNVSRDIRMRRIRIIQKNILFENKNRKNTKTVKS